MSERNRVAEGRDARLSVSGHGARRRIQRTILYTSAEWEAIVERARVAGKTPHRFIRETSLGRLPRARLALIRELGASGTALTRLAATARATGALPEAGSLDAALAELLTAVRRLG